MPDIWEVSTPVSRRDWRMFASSQAGLAGCAIGIYHFWRNLGCGIGALGLGLAAWVFDGITVGF